MRPHGSPKELEARRLRAVALLQQGLSLTQVARMVGSHPSSVMRWRDAHEESGEVALKAKPVPGRPAKLTWEIWGAYEIGLGSSRVDG